MSLILSVLTILLNFSHAECVKDDITPSGWKAIHPYSESITNKIIRCNLSVEIALQRDDRKKVVSEYYMEQKLTPSGDVKKRILRQRAMDQIKNYGEPRERPKLIESDFVLKSNNATNNPNDRSHLLPLFGSETYKKIKLHNLGLSKKFFGQNIVYCNSNGKELSKIHLAAFSTATIMGNRATISPTAYQNEGKVEQTKSVITSTKRTPNGETQLEVYLPHNSRHVYLTCRDVIDNDPQGATEEERSTASQKSN